MRQALGVEPLGRPRLAHHLDRALLEHAGANPAENVIPADAVEDDVVDAGGVSSRPSSSPDGPEPMMAT